MIDEKKAVLLPVAVEDLQLKVTPKGEYLCVAREEKGLPTTELLAVVEQFGRFTGAQRRFQSLFILQEFLGVLIHTHLREHAKLLDYGLGHPLVGSGRFACQFSYAFPHFLYRQGFAVRFLRVVQ